MYIGESSLQSIVAYVLITCGNGKFGRCIFLSFVTPPSGNFRMLLHKNCRESRSGTKESQSTRISGKWFLKRAPPIGDESLGL